VELTVSTRSVRAANQGSVAFKMRVVATNSADVARGSVQAVLVLKPKDWVTLCTATLSGTGTATCHLRAGRFAKGSYKILANFLPSPYDQPGHSDSVVLKVT
jgi:hypothetical protein